MALGISAPCERGELVDHSLQRPHMVTGEYRDVGNRVSLVLAVSSKVPKSGMLAMKRPSLSRSIIAQYQTLYMRYLYFHAGQNEDR